jgi:hypothetical protein
MSNPIKYSTGSETLALKKGNFYIGTGDVGKGPTNSTGYYNGISPPSGGYTIYLNKETGGPSIYTVTNDTQLISLTNSIAGQSYTTANECLVYFAGQTDKMVLNRNYEGIVTDGLVFNLDGGFTPSYPKSGTTWYSVGQSGNTTSLSNGPTFNSNNGGSIVFDGSDDYGTITSTGAYGNNSFSITVAVYPEFDNITFGRPIFTKTDSCGSTLEFGIEYNRNNVPSGQPNKFSVLIGGNLAMESSSQYLKNNWYIVTSNYNSSDGSYSLYVNGELSASGTTGLDVGSGNGNWGIGRWDGCYPNVPPWLGKISVILFYNKSLNNNQSIQNYNALKGRFGL